MEIVIKIPEHIYENNIKNDLPIYLTEDNIIKILPQGHGALKDVDNIKTAFPSGEYVRTESVKATIDHEETIIEADKEG